MKLPNESTMNEVVTRWSATLSTTKFGELIIAEEVVSMASRWDSEDSYSSFLREHLGRGLSLKRFKEWAHCVEHLGKEAKRTVETRAAVWLTGAVPKDQVPLVMQSIFRFKREKNKGAPVTLAMAKRIALPMLGRKVQKRAAGPCPRCKELESLLEKHGVSSSE